MKRYDLEPPYEYEADNGRFVLFTDHLASQSQALAEQRERYEALIKKGQTMMDRLRTEEGSVTLGAALAIASFGEALAALSSEEK